MAVAVEQNNGIEEDLVGPESKSLPPPPPMINDNDNKEIENEPERDVVGGLEKPEVDPKKKKSSSYAFKDFSAW